MAGTLGIAQEGTSASSLSVTPFRRVFLLCRMRCNSIVDNALRLLSVQTAKVRFLLQLLFNQRELLPRLLKATIGLSVSFFGFIVFSRIVPTKKSRQSLARIN